MATFTSSDVRIFIDDAAGVVSSAFRKTFYGVGNSASLPEANGYPDASLTNVFTDITKYEITAPTAMGVNLSITSNDATVTASSAYFSSGDVGKVLYNGADPNNLIPIGKILTYTDSTHVELEANNTTGYTTVAGYIMSSASNGFSIPAKRGFYVLVKVEEDGGTPENKYIPSPKQLSASSPYTEIGGIKQFLNTTYVNLNRVSKVGNKGNTQVAEVPAVISRVNNYVSVAGTYFPTEGDIPLWVAFYVNPYGSTSKNLDKDTMYSLSFDEVVPISADGSDTIQPIIPGAASNYASIVYGEI